MGCVESSSAQPKNYSYAVTTEDEKVASADGNIREDAERVTGPIAVHSDAVFDVCLLGGKTNQLYSCGDDNRVVRYDWRNGALLDEWSGHTSCVNKVCVTADGRVYSASRDRTIKQWRCGQQEAMSEFTGHDMTIQAMVLNKNESMMCTGSRDSSIRFWDLETGTCVRKGLIERNLVTCLSWLAPDVVVQGGEDLALKIWDTRTSTVVHAFEKTQYFPLDCHGSADGLSLVTGENGFDGNGCGVKAWDMRQRCLRAEGRSHEHAVRAVLHGVSSSGNTFIASASKDRSIKLWDPDLQPVASTTLPESGAFSSLSYSKTENNETLLVAGSEGGAIGVWDIGGGNSFKLKHRTRPC